MKNIKNEIFKKGCMILIIAVLLILLSGCNTVTYKKKYTEEEDLINATSKITVDFKEDIAQTVELVLKFENEEEAKEYYDNYKIFNDLLEDNKMELELKKKKLTIKMQATQYIKIDEPLTKEVVKKYLEDKTEGES